MPLDSEFVDMIDKRILHDARNDTQFAKNLKGLIFAPLEVDQSILFRFQSEVPGSFIDNNKQSIKRMDTGNFGSEESDENDLGSAMFGSKRNFSVDLNTRSEVVGKAKLQKSVTGLSGLPGSNMTSNHRSTY